MLKKRSTVMALWYKRHCTLFSQHFMLAHPCKAPGKHAAGHDFRTLSRFPFAPSYCVVSAAFRHTRPSLATLVPPDCLRGGLFLFVCIYDNRGHSAFSKLAKLINAKLPLAAFCWTFGWESNSNQGNALSA
jgi:hypothetical protein